MKYIGLLRRTTIDLEVVPVLVCFKIDNDNLTICAKITQKRARSLVVSDLRLETKGYGFKSVCYLQAEVNFLQ